MPRLAKKKVRGPNIKKIDESEMIKENENFTILKDDLKDLLMEEMRESLYKKVDEIIINVMENIDRSLEARLDAIKSCLDKVKK